MKRKKKRKKKSAFEKKKMTKGQRKQTREVEDKGVEERLAEEVGHLSDFRGAEVGVFHEASLHAWGLLVEGSVQERSDVSNLQKRSRQKID